MFSFVISLHVSLKVLMSQLSAEIHCCTIYSVRLLRNVTRWTDYKEVDRRFRALEAAFEATNRQKLNSMSVHRTMFNPAVPCPATLHEQRLVPPCPCPQHRGVGYKGGKDCACMEDRPSEIAPSGGRDGGNNLDVSQGTYQLTAVGQGDGAGVHGGDGSSKKRFSHAGQQQHSRASGFRPTHIADHGWGYCPPIGLDPRCLIRPRNTALHNSVRPTGYGCSLPS